MKDEELPDDDDEINEADQEMTPYEDADDDMPSEEELAVYDTDYLNDDDDPDEEDAPDADDDPDEEKRNG